MYKYVQTKENLVSITLQVILQVIPHPALPLTAAALLSVW